MSSRPSAHPGRVWKLYALASVVVVAASLLVTVPSGDRTIILLTLSCDLVFLVVATAVTYALVAPQPHRESEAYGAPGRGGHIASVDSKYRGTWL
ncbi:hypothetical protein [Nocardioides zhouii]|uniref:Uncharacterized protein n=1 Tax=Nocardioides zhouii TaxID=1168729 RepID=A0A4Q2SEX6_9ACTN|nr:hypothetical protein [Nocardioides zhouii]RYC03311.1 hypothetical protein EUA94_21825 [Nocardioides zhouii]